LLKICYNKGVLSWEKEQVKLQEIRRYGFIATPRKARKAIVCIHCHGGIIRQGEEYYRVIVVGSGLRGIKYPDRVHAKCIDAWLERYREFWDSPSLKRKGDGNGC